MGRAYDFSGWATKADLLCSDGRIIRKDAFKDDDGKTVPLVWNHQHNDPDNVLGHAMLKNTDNGVYAYCTFNESKKGQTAKMLVEHGDIRSLSIFANKLVQKGPEVMHGVIRELSLVLAGANPGAFIENVIAHGDEVTDMAYIFADEPLNLEHGEIPEEPEQKDEGDSSIAHASDDKPADNKGEEASASTGEKKENEKTVADVVDSMTEEQKNVTYFLIGKALEQGDAEEDSGDDEDEDNDTEGGNDNMKHNVFEGQGTQELKHNALTPEAQETIISDAKRYGSMKESVLQHADTYGIQQIDWLFPDARNLNNPPEFIKRDTTWVQKVMSAVHHSPFSRIKSTFADITEDDARAKGYMKGNLKKEEVFSLLKRTTSPTTVYKKQKMDRDDVVDITDFDVISWLKTEMRMMLDEELARAYLIGDGRLASSDDKINEQNIRPIMKDDELFTIQAAVIVPSTATADDVAKTFIRTAIKARKDYKGSGNPVLFTTEDMLTDMLLLEDTIGHTLYDEASLARKLRVREIITVPVMEGVKGKNGGDLLGIIVNLNDYNVGADRGGAINMFDDFDIDYNQQKYLIETRCSGALTKPYSAIALEKKVQG